MPDLIEFLRAQYDAEADAARAATPGPWSVDHEVYPESINGPDGQAVISGARWGGEAGIFDEAADAHHVAAWDPARVLREVEAKRQILGLHVNDGAEWGLSYCRTCEDRYGHDAAGWPCATFRLLALPYSDHPDYDESWRP